MRNPKRRILTLMAATLMLAPVSAHADPGHGHGNGNGQWKHYEGRNDDNENYDRHDHGYYRIDSRDRQVIGRYVDKRYFKKCPPGLAKKHNGCLPPGHARRYEIGRPLPAGVIYRPVPQSVLVQLQPVPQGYEYVQVDDDVVLLGTLTKMVIDAITTSGR
jgi:Ni/Co efflux regulator RcnB